jgi:hypothetical protein
LLERIVARRKDSILRVVVEGRFGETKAKEDQENGSYYLKNGGLVVVFAHEEPLPEQ